LIALVKAKAGPGHVSLKDVPISSPGADHMMIDVQATGVCGSDLYILSNDIKLNLRPPVIMGHVFCGVVEQVGDGVEAFNPGGRVTSETTFRSCATCRHCRSGRYNLCPEKELMGYVHDGCFARYCLVPAERVHALPENVSFEEGALCEPLACCVHAAMEQTDIRPGDTVVVTGLGAVGLLCARVARACGADVFLECAGAAEAANNGIRHLRRGRRFCQVGLVGTPFELDFEQVAYKELTVTGSIGSKRSSWLKALQLLPDGTVDTRPLAALPLPLKEWRGKRPSGVSRRRKA